MDAAHEHPVVIITGAGSGIGRATAEVLAAAGYSLVLAGRRAEALHETAERCDGCDECLVVPTDVSRADEVKNLIESAASAFGRIDALVNNAGHARVVPVDRSTPEVFDEAIARNAAPVAYATHAVWPHLLARGGGTIVNISSMAAVDPFPGFFAYAAAKAAVSMMTVAAAKEGARHNIRAFALAPGAVETAMLRGSFSTKAVPESSCLQPIDVARHVLACIRGDRDALSGHTIPLMAEPVRSGWFDGWIGQHPAAWLWTGPTSPA